MCAIPPEPFASDISNRVMAAATVLYKDRSPLDPPGRHMIPPARHINSNWSCHALLMTLDLSPPQHLIAEYGDGDPVA